MAPAGSLLQALQQVPDPRGAQGRRFSLVAMLATIAGAVLCGARGPTAIAQWIHSQDPQVWYWLGYYRRPPKVGAFHKLLMALDSDAFEAVLRKWVVSVLPALGAENLSAVSLDGKTLCGTEGGHGRAVHLLSLLDQRTGCVLSQQAIGETNEAKAAIPLLKTLLLDGRVITGDAMFCNREICSEITDSGGDYLVVVKDNQADLKEQIAAEFRAGFSPSCRSTTDRIA
jgi:hypothetical protein